eukprot:gene33166-40923_t
MSADGFSGDGGLATSAQFHNCRQLSGETKMDGHTYLYIADLDNNRVRMINTFDSIISTIVGTGGNANAGDGTLAVTAQTYTPVGVWVDSMGTLFVSSSLQYNIRQVLTDGYIYSFANVGGSYGNSAGDSETRALYGTLNYPNSVWGTTDGTMYASDIYNNKIV